MNVDEIQFFRDSFKNIDIYTPTDVEKWLRSYPELTITEHCTIMRRSPNVIERIKRECGMSKIAIVDVGDKWIISDARKHNKKPSKAKAVAPRDFDGEWVKEQYEMGRSINWLCKTCKCSHVKIENTLRDYDVKRKTHSQIVQIKNQYYSKEWVEENYVKRGYHMRKCAEIAGVSHCTIRYWMMKFNIEPRSIYEIGVIE